MKTHTEIRNLTLSAMFLALGLVLPLLTGQIQTIGNMLCPMHIPVLLCGLICGWKYGLGVGAVLPLLRFVLFGMPPIYPTAIAMTFELAAYGFLVGFLYENSRWQCIVSLYRCMIISMTVGRVISGIANYILYAAKADTYTMSMFVASNFINSIPGILLQLTLIPAIMFALDRTGLYKFKKKAQTADAAES
ncbi:MAG: ECF transporter S component [Firmicutes bacterium]|nr:ECF transporter S component [Bacillota bacterium]